MSKDIEAIRTFDSQVKIPNELLQFLRQDTYSLLINGNAGTGKTTLALSILRILNINKNCLYISTRISPEQLFQYYPWIKEFFDQTKQIEDIETSTTEVSHPIFVDGRLDEPSSLFERITNELMDVRAPIIVIDTWDAIGFLMDKEALANNAKVLQTWRERAGAKIIFVTENPEDKTFDFLVDGIIELRQKYYNERRVREIFLSKLHGVRINRPSYIFSVNNNLFHSYDHYSPSEFFKSVHFSSVEGADTNLFKNKSHFTTGYHELDKMLGGGFPVRSAVNIELFPHVNAKIAFALLSKIIANFIASQNSLLFQPFEKTGHDMIMQYQKSFNHKKELINVITERQSKKLKDDEDSNISQLRQVRQLVQKIKKKHPKKMLLSIICPDTGRSTSKTIPDTDNLEVLSFIKANSDLSVFISRRMPDNRHTQVSEISDMRFSILDLDGTVFLQSETPWSQLYAIVTQSDKLDGVQLEPIV
ncbi:MAG: RAD55 family ATPase [Nitrosotalea sp.]